MGYDPLNSLFQEAFPSGNIQSWSWGEDVWSNRIVWIAVPPQGTREETRTTAIDAFQRVMQWLKANTNSWNAQDRLAVVVGLPPHAAPSPDRRIVHGWVEVGRLAEVVELYFGKAGGGFAFSPDWIAETI